MSKAFTNDDAVAKEAELPMPVGRRPVTAQGFAKMQTTQRELLATALPELTQLGASGDLSAQARLQALQRRLQLLARQLELCDVAPEPDPVPAKVVLGAEVTVRDEEDDQQLRYILVGPDEVDVAARRISFASPVGQALLGRKVGERAFLKRPAGVREVVVVAIAAAKAP